MIFGLSSSQVSTALTALGPSLSDLTLDVMFKCNPLPATVHGIVDAEGTFDGHISTPSETYYVEPAHR